MGEYTISQHYYFFEGKIYGVSNIKDVKVDETKQEGYVIRLESGFRFEDSVKSIAKYVREKHVQTDQHWMQSEVIPNKLK